MPAVRTTHLCLCHHVWDERHVFTATILHLVSNVFHTCFSVFKKILFSFRPLEISTTWVSDADWCDIVFFIVLTVLEINALQRDYKVQDYKELCHLSLTQQYMHSCKFCVSVNNKDL